MMTTKTRFYLLLLKMQCLIDQMCDLLEEVVEVNVDKEPTDENMADTRKVLHKCHIKRSSLPSDVDGDDLNDFKEMIEAITEVAKKL